MFDYNSLKNESKINIYQKYEKLNMFECYTESNKNKEAALDLYFQRSPGDNSQKNLKFKDSITIKVSMDHAER